MKSTNINFVARTLCNANIEHLDGQTVALRTHSAILKFLDFRKLLSTLNLCDVTEQKRLFRKRSKRRSTLNNIELHVQRGE